MTVTVDVLQARDTIARDMILKALDNYQSEKYAGWEDYPELAKSDYEGAVERAKSLATLICRTDRFDGDYAHLAQRAGYVGGGRDG